jgi:thiamine pyrophosphate-dependent acetolactate synthase large subunit-like protein
MVLIAGDTDKSLHLARQNIDQAALVAPTGAAFQRVASARTAADDVARAVGRAWRERRPVVLDIPVDVQEAEIDYVPSRIAPYAFQATIPDPETIDQAVGVIASARRPVIVAGRGAVLSGAKSALVALAQRIGAPLATTLLARDYFRGEPFNLGICGTLSSNIASEVLASADCLVFFGAGINEWTSAHGSLTKDKAIVQVDIESARIGEQAPTSVGVIGDARQSALTLTQWLNGLDPEPALIWCSPNLQQKLESYSPFEEVTPYPTDRVDPRIFTMLLDSLLPANRTFVTDTGLFMVSPIAWLHVLEPQAFVQTIDFGSIGLGLATGIGASFARPDRPVVVTIGDGGLAQSIGEFITAVRYGLDLVVVVYNNDSYAAEIAVALREGLDLELARLPTTDFARIAEGMGGVGVTVESLDDLNVVAKAIASPHRPLLIDAKVDHLQDNRAPSLANDRRTP